MRAIRIVMAGFAIVSVVSTAPALGSPQKDIARLRMLFFQRDFETGMFEGAKLIAASPGISELKAWYVLNVVRWGQDKEALALAREMTAANPNDAWAWFAFAGSLTYQREGPVDAVAASEKALKLMPDNPDIIWIHANALAHDEKRRSEAITFIDSERPHVKNPAEILTTKAYVLYLQSSSPVSDDTKMNAALATFEEARRVDQTNLSAWYLPGVYLNERRRSDEAYPLLKKAISLAPGSIVVHDAFWRAVLGSHEFSAERKRQEAEGDMKAFVQMHGDRPGSLVTVAIFSRNMKWTDMRQEAEEKILKDFPDTREAEGIFADRWMDLKDTAGGAQAPQYRQLLREFIARPHHHSEDVLGEAYLDLFEVLANDNSSSGDELYQAVKGVVQYEKNNPQITYVSTAITLADRKIHLEDAERIARDGIEALRKTIESQRKFYESQGEYDRASDEVTALGYDALGWVLLAQGRAGEAGKELIRSYELNLNNRTNLDHLGRYYESRNDLAKAEEYYIRGLAVQSPGLNPCETSFRSLYAKRHGSLEGIGDYLAKLQDADRTKRRDRVLAERLSSPVAVLAFDLKSLDGKRVSLDSLKGKIIVVNFWGIWCGWCIQELPDYQKLYEKYANDPGIAILTINNDLNPDDVPPWMAQKKYNFPVLIDNGYVGKVGIKTFPTTWFLDAQGRKVSEKVGWSEKLLEEFSWRIEAMRPSAAKRG